MSLSEAERAAAAIRSIKKDEEFLDHLRTVDRYPHKAQIKIMRKVLNDRPKYTFLQCSRNWGKSTFAAISAVLHAGRTPRSRYYIFAPYRPQAAEIYWASGLLEMIIPPSWIKSETQFNKSEMRILLTIKALLKLMAQITKELCAELSQQARLWMSSRNGATRVGFRLSPTFLLSMLRSLLLVHLLTRRIFLLSWAMISRRR